MLLTPFPKFQPRLFHDQFAPVTFHANRSALSSNCIISLHRCSSYLLNQHNPITPHLMGLGKPYSFRKPLILIAQSFSVTSQVVQSCCDQLIHLHFNLFPSDDLPAFSRDLVILSVPQDIVFSATPAPWPPSFSETEKDQKAWQFCSGRFHSTQ